MEVRDSRISIMRTFPDLAAVRRTLYPDSYSERTTLEEFEASLALRGALTPAVSEAIEKAKAIRENTDVIFYIAGPLTGVSEEMKERYALVSKMLSGYSALSEKPDAFFGYVPHLHGTDPIKHPEVTADEVRDIDHLWAAVMADFHVNLLYPIAHGNAIEEGWGESRMVPTSYLNESGNALSRLTKGMHNVIVNIGYENFAPVSEAERQFVDGEKMPEFGWHSENPRKPFASSGLGRLRLVIDEIHAWVKTFPDRDPREFHYLSFYRLANSAARMEGLEPKSGLEPEEIEERFASGSLIAYINYPGHKYYGKVGTIEFFSNYKGIGVITLDGYPYLFDALQYSHLSIWPVPEGMKIESRRKTQSEPFADPKFNIGDVYGRQEGD